MITYVLLFSCLNDTRIDFDAFVYKDEPSCQAAKGRAQRELPPVCKQWAAECLPRELLESKANTDTIRIFDK
jgi:hypothetical protein